MVVRIVEVYNKTKNDVRVDTGFGGEYLIESGKIIKVDFEIPIYSTGKITIFHLQPHQRICVKDKDYHIYISNNDGKTWTRKKDLVSNMTIRAEIQEDDLSFIPLTIPNIYLGPSTFSSYSKTPPTTKL